MPLSSPETVKKRNTVIIVDDDEDLLKLLVFAFESEGFTTHGIASGKEALAYLCDESKTESACLLILDRILPDMDGLDILKRLPEKTKMRTPVLILSMLAEERDVLTGIKSGAVDYITKPFNLPVLLEKSIALIERYS